MDERAEPTDDRAPHRAVARAARGALDREEQLIKDAVLRMGSLVEAAIRQASRALTSTTPTLALRRHQGATRGQRGAARGIARSS